MRVTIVAIAGLAALTACSKAPSAGGSTSASASAPAAPAAPPAPALFSRPHPKPGLWEMVMTNDAGPGMDFTFQRCISAKTEDSAFQGGGPRGMSKSCGGPPKMSPAPGGGVAMDATCKTGGRTITTHMVATGDFNSAYTLDMSSHMDPAAPGVGNDIHTQVKARWLGPCKSGEG
jgi:hypothetical protein